MGLFKKENCCLCDGETGLLDKKCRDGKVCKDCASKMSVWFDDYKESTKDDLKMQLVHKVTDETKAVELDFTEYTASPA